MFCSQFDTSLVSNPWTTSLAEAYQAQRYLSTDMLRRPSATSQTRNGKPLLIPDHISRLVPFEEEKILSTGH